jgi:TonB family protein
LNVPKVRLAFLHAVLLVSLVLPAIRPWRHEAISGKVTASTVIVDVAEDRTESATTRLPISELVLLVVMSGILVRLGFMLAGLWRLHRYRIHSRPLEPESPWGSEADLRISEDISGPVTFGFRRPVVLLPRQFSSLRQTMQEAILCHEILHVRRHDWLFTLGEEAIRAVLWFHPAIWWLLREIQLAREETVDREAVAMTRARDEYIDALLVIAGAPQSDVAPAPLFLRKRHLKQRIGSILKEIHMSKAKSFSTLGAALTLLAVAGWFAAGLLPLRAAPQEVMDASGVSVNVSGAQLMHRDPVEYPKDAIAKGVQGIVLAAAKVDSSGNVTEATIVSGPEELRKPVLQSVLNWHFAPEAGVTTHQIAATFVAPGQARTSGPPEPAPVIPAALQNRTVKTIQTRGIPDRAREELLGRIPVHVGDTLTATLYEQLLTAVQAYDSHLAVVALPVSPTEAAVAIGVRGAPLVPDDIRRLTTASANRPAPAAVPSPAAAPFPAPPTAGLPAPPPPPQPIRIGSEVQQMNLINKVTPAYPALAKAAHVQGVVEFQATIGKDGMVQDLQLVSGPPLLVQAAMQAVQQWVYKPTLLNGNPVEVLTTIDVNFTLVE